MDKPLILENLDTKFYSKIEDAISYLERKQQFYGDSSSQKAEEIAEIIKDFDATFYALQKTFTPSDIEKIEKKALIKIKQSQKQKPVFLGRQLDKKISDAKDILESLKDSIAEQPITPIAVTPSNSKIASDNAKNTFEGAIRDFITAKPTDLPRVNDRTDYRNKGAFYLLSYGPRNQITSRLIFNSGKNNYSATIQNGEVQIYQVNLDSPATTETAIDKNSESYLSVLKNINQTIAKY